MKKLCVIGCPIAHSKSPLLHGAMLAALGLDYSYTAQLVPAGGVEQWLSAAKAEHYVGFNATSPHKQALVPYLDVLDEDATLFHAVNTVCIRDGILYGYNTDGHGFLQALADEGLALSGQAVTLLGAGGAARAVALKLAQQGAKAVIICNRTLPHAVALCAHAPGLLRPAGFGPEDLRQAAAQSDLLVNCTSLGMAGTEGQFASFSFLDALPPGAAVFDLIYAPAETALLAAARQRGHQGFNGLGMLVHQAVLSLEHFTGVDIDAGAMKRLLAPLL